MSSRTVFQGRVVSLRVDTVALPGGGQATREVVVHRGSVVIVPVDREGQVLLVRQYRHAAGRVLLEAPAGTLDPDEDPATCAQRELREETGYMAGDLRRLGGFWASPGFCSEYLHVFLARDLRHAPLEADADEDIRVVRVPLARVPEMVLAGEVEDAKTVASLLMALRVLGES